MEIASHLESTGEPGYVHVSSVTMQMLHFQGLEVQPGTMKAQQDPVIKRQSMKTYLITGIPARESVRRTIDFASPHVFDAKAYHEPIHHMSYVDHTAEEIEDEIQKIPIVSVK